MQKRYRVRDTVRVHNVNGGYPLPDGLTDDMEVKVVAIDVGCCTVEREGKLYQVFQPCIDSGYIELTKLPPLRSGPAGRNIRGARGREIRVAQGQGLGRKLPGMAFDRAEMAMTAVRLAAKGVFIGTSSWKYVGWLNQLYTPARYEYRGKVATTRFERNCLREYAEVFKTVCVDAAYYTFPSVKYLEGLAALVPADFQFGFKVTDEITVRKFPNLPRFRVRAGKPNENFLNADLFSRAFLKPCESIRSQVGVLMFEFSRFYQTDYAHGRDFVADLDRFLGELPKGWPYAIEMRNKAWLAPEYFACLARHGVTHVFNSWSAMPAVPEQLAMAGSRTNPALVAARFLLKPGRGYEEAVKTFQPYDRTKEVNDEARQAGAALMVEGEQYEPRRKTYIYVNNRLEGNALETLAAMNALAVKRGLGSRV